MTGTCGDRLGRAAPCGDVIAQASEERTSTRSGDRVTFLFVKMEGFGAPRACHLKTSGLVENVCEVEQHICALAEEVRLLGQADGFKGQRLGLLRVSAPGENAGADGSPHHLGK
jgi:hypothetical protein